MIKDEIVGDKSQANAFGAFKRRPEWRVNVRKAVLQDMKNCCACGLCELICPVHAIRMQSNQYGFLEPVIDRNRCVDCGLCEKKCVAQQAKVERPIQCFAGVNLNGSVKGNSSSGGAFAALAEDVLEHGGVVFGAATIPKNNVMTIEHIMIEHKEQLSAIQGSKYVQSNARNSYAEVKRQLEKKRKVLFSGTPCQVAAIKNYLGKADPNLLLVDLICHGTPSALYWEQSLQEKLKKNEKITRVSFRGAEGYMRGEIAFSGGAVGKRNEKYTFTNDAYYSFFLGGDTYNEGCYHCPYAQMKRGGDITLGDFWGAEREYDLDSMEKEQKIDLHHGLSLILVNSHKGLEACDSVKNQKLWLREVDYAKAAQYNAQLNRPSNKGKNRRFILWLYAIGSWKFVSSYWKIKKYIKKNVRRK